MTTVVSILMSDIVPLRERGTWQGIINIIFASGAGIGAPLGGILADSIGWRWAFLGQFPLCVLAFLIVSVALNLPRTEDSDWKTKLARVDFPGALTLVCAVFTLLLGLDRGSNVSWSATITIICLCMALPLFMLFVLVEQKFATEPFAPGRIIFNRSLFACYLCNFFSFGGWLACIFYLPLYFQAVNGLSATQSGVQLLPGILSGVFGSLFGGIFMQKTGKYYVLTIAAYASLTLGVLSILLCTGLVTSNFWGVAVGLVVAAFGNGIGVTTTLISLIANAAPADQAVATACSYLFRSLGSVLGLSLGATVVQQSLRNQLSDRLGSGNEADEIVRKVRQSLDYIDDLDPKIAEIVRQCYGMATNASFILMTGIVACAFLSACKSVPPYMWVATNISQYSFAKRSLVNSYVQYRYDTVALPRANTQMDLQS
jgi:predicted MFS family arabinose efflux permease